ncbi:MAG: TerB family tellurite resistance protein [Alphaproteobacteria bacterium]|nr:TerB family tellurite resistance protein [Alphaproteobacteria bacterium]
MSAAWQVIADCPHCHTHGAVLQLMDPDNPACHLGVPAVSECQMCGRTETAGEPELLPRDPIGSNRCPACRKPLSVASREAACCDQCGWGPEVVVQPGLDLSDETLVRAGLSRWAASEGLTIDELCAGSLGGPTDDVVGRYLRGEPVESSMDAIAFLFPGMAAGSALGAHIEAPVRAERDAPSTERAPDPRAAARLLVSVMVADGQIRAGERAYVDAFLAKESMAPLTPSELRPWRPHEIGPVGDFELARRAVQAAVELMHLDGERDGSELRIVRTFARAWGVPEREVDAWNRQLDRHYAPPLRVVWRALDRWVRTR